MTRNTRTTTLNDLTFEVFEPTDGQIAIIAQQSRLAMRAGVTGDSASRAMATVMTVLDKLVVNEIDRDQVSDLIIAGDVSLVDVVNAILGVSMETEVSDATPKAIRAKRTK